jgi:hypothetical protein
MRICLGITSFYSRLYTRCRLVGRRAARRLVAGLVETESLYRAAKPAAPNVHIHISTQQRMFTSTKRQALMTTGCHRIEGSDFVVGGMEGVGDKHLCIDSTLRTNGNYWVGLAQRPGEAEITRRTPRDVETQPHARNRYQMAQNRVGRVGAGVGSPRGSDSS